LVMLAAMRRASSRVVRRCAAGQGQNHPSGFVLYDHHQSPLGTSASSGHGRQGQGGERPSMMWTVERRAGGRRRATSERAFESQQKILAASVPQALPISTKSENTGPSRHRAIRDSRRLRTYPRYGGSILGELGRQRRIGKKFSIAGINGPVVRSLSYTPH
jgi:hypothetical protein